jgi:hypothetical protein
MSDTSVFFCHYTTFPMACQACAAAFIPSFFRCSEGCERLPMHRKTDDMRSGIRRIKIATFLQKKALTFPLSYDIIYP